MVHLNYREWDPDEIRENLTREQLQHILNQLLLHVDGDVQEAMNLMRRLQERGVLPDDLDLEGFLEEIARDGVVVMDDTTDAVRACLRVVRFFARESCGKCTPCREGTTWEETVLQRILDGNGRHRDIDMLLDIGDNISPGPYPVAANEAEGQVAVPFPPRQTTICPLGPSSVAPITSAIRRFRNEFEAKIVLPDTLPVAAVHPAAAELAAAAKGEGQH